MSRHASVVATGSVTIDTAGLTLEFSNNFEAAEIFPTHGTLITGPGVAIDVFNGITGPATFGSGGVNLPTIGSGNTVGVVDVAGNIFVSAGQASQQLGGRL